MNNAREPVIRTASPSLIEAPARRRSRCWHQRPRIALERMADIATALVDVIEHEEAVRDDQRPPPHHRRRLDHASAGCSASSRSSPTHGRMTPATGSSLTSKARTLDGRVVGAAEGECSRAERNWKNRDPYAIDGADQGDLPCLRAPLGQMSAGHQPAAARRSPPTV